MNRMFVIHLLLAGISLVQSEDKDPCGDSLTMALLAKPLDSLSENEMTYFLHMKDNCEQNTDVKDNEKKGEKTD